MKDIFFNFHSIKEFQNYLINNEVQDNFKGQEKSQEVNSFRTEFTGTKDFCEANDKLMKGDDDLKKKIEDAGYKKESINLQKNHIKKQLYGCVVGSIPNVPAYISGSPNSMIAQKNIKVRKRILTIGYSISVPWFITQKDIIRCSSNFLTAICKLESSGIKTNIYTCLCLKQIKKKSFFGFATQVKSSSHKLDILRIAYPLAHPSFFRRHGFRFMEVTKGLSKETAVNYGECIDHQEQKKVICSKIKLDAFISVDMILHMTVDDIFNNILEQVKK